MPLITWPTELPLPRQQGYGFSETDTRIKTNMAYGKPRLRRTARLAVRSHSFTLRCSFAQQAFFDRWYYDTLKGGVLPFAIPIHTGAGITVVEATFDTLGQWQHQGVAYHRTLTIETTQLPALALDAQTMQAMLEYGTSQIYVGSTNSEEVVN